MAFYIRPDQPGFAGALGSGLGQGFSQGFNTTLSQKMELLNRQQRLEGLLKSLGQGMPSSEAGMSIPTQASRPGFPDLGQLSQEQLGLLAAEEPLAKPIVQPRIEEHRERTKAAVGLEKGQAEKVYEELGKGEEQLPILEQSVREMEKAVESGEVGPLSLANLSERFKIPELQTAKGQAFKTAQKEFLAGSIKGVSARGLNRWLEQKVYEGLPQIGESKEAARPALEALRFRNNVLREKSRFVRELQEKEGLLPKNLNKRINEHMEEFIKLQSNRDAIRLQEQVEKGLSDAQLLSQLKTPQGKFLKAKESETPLTMRRFDELVKLAKGDEKKAEKIAKRLGYDTEALYWASQPQR